MACEKKSLQQFEPVMISALEHYSYCPRQFALIHVEQSYDENIFTLQGSLEHKRVDEGYSAPNAAVIVESSLPVWSERLGLVGRADIVEFYEGVPYPVEYKHGAKRMGVHAELQLCAQAICLEEMFGCPVARGAVYQCSSHRRREVAITDDLRMQVERTASNIRAVFECGKIPEPVNDARCENCSLIDLCLPHAVGERRRLRRIGRALFEVIEV